MVLPKDFLDLPMPEALVAPGVRFDALFERKQPIRKPVHATECWKVDDHTTVGNAAKLCHKPRPLFKVW